MLPEVERLERRRRSAVEQGVEWLPNREHAVVPRPKIADYLLSNAHPDGQSKARFFTRFGFSAARWEVLAAALRRHASDHLVVRIEPSPFGQRYVIEGILHAPDGRTPLVRSIWFIATGGEVPWLVTAYPGSEVQHDS